MTLRNEEFGDNPAIKHVAFGWDDPPGKAGDVAPFVETGFKAETTVVLTASAVHAPPKLANGISIRRIANDEDWHAVQALQIECRPPEIDDESYATFMTQRLRTMRKLTQDHPSSPKITQALHGDWYGAFDGDLLVGDLGLFVDPSTRVGRFQGVETRSTHRRRGICGALVHTVAERALQDLGVTQLVMLADADSHAAKIYESVGFRPTEHLIGLCKS